MDLSIQLENKKLNIRVAVILKNKNGYIFEQKEGKEYIFTVGGRVKAGESSLESAKREVFEELNLNIEDLKIRAIIENFFIIKDLDVHEFCFVYGSEKEIEDELPNGFISINKEKVRDFDIRPEIIKELILNEDKSLKHFILK